MKKLAILMVLALELAVCGCGTTTPTNQVNTQTSGNWEARLIGGTGEASKLNFVAAFSVTNSGPLSVPNPGFSFFNNNACFANGTNGSTQSGTATLVTGSTNQVTGTLSFTVTSITPAGNTLTLTGNLTGTSNGTIGTTGTLSNGIVVGDWQLSGGAGDPSCSAKGTFLMCQGAPTCIAP